MTPEQIAKETMAAWDKLKKEERQPMPSPKHTPWCAEKILHQGAGFGR